jgi:ADP-heptose:LPS heptosyltransferase
MLLDLPAARATLVDVRQVANVERNRDLLRAAGFVPDDEPGYLVPDEWIASARERVAGRIAVHIGSIVHDGLAAKRWSSERFTLLCGRLVADGWEVVLVVGPDELQESDALQREVPGVGRFEGPLPSVARFLSTCGLAVANDNGIAHLAAGVRTPVISLFGPTPVEFGPFSPTAIALRPSLCPPCFDVRRPVVRCVLNLNFACLTDLSVDLVYRTVAEQMKPARP